MSPSDNENFGESFGLTGFDQAWIEASGGDASVPAPPPRRIAPRRRWELALAIIVKDERDYLAEWVAYHHAIGVQHIYVYDHGSTDGTAESIAHWVNRGLVTVIGWPRVHGQFDAYDHAVRLATGQTDWLGIIDTDEFICAKADVTLRDFLRGLDADQLLIRWRWFGHGGHRERPQGLVIESYDRVQPALSNIVKSIFRPEAVVTAGVHNQRTVGRRTVDVLGRPASEAWQLKIAAEGDEPFQVNHYYCRSYAEYLRKMNRGDANVNKTQEVRPFEAFDFDGVDRTLIEFAPQVRERLAAMAALPEDPLPSGGLGDGVAPDTPVALYHLLRDRLVEGAAALGAGATFAKSDLGIRIRYDALDGDEAALVGRLRGMLAGIGGWWGAAPAGELPAVETGAAPPSGALVRTPRRLRNSLFDGHVFAAALVRASGPGVVRLRLHARAGEEEVREAAHVRVRGGGLWLAIQRVGSRPNRPFSVRFRWAEGDGLEELLDARLWFVS